MEIILFWGVASFLLSANAATLARRAVGTATVSLASPSGTPSQLASGFIYGIPDNGTSVSTAIPDNFYRDFGFKACRAGGAQLGVPNRGWAYGEQEYVGRWASTLSNYRTSRKFGAEFIVLVHDLWGADGLDANGLPYPGDNGDWSLYERFTDRLISDMQSNGMIDGVILDIWNEPDGTNFWNRPYTQYLDYYVRAHNKFRARLSGMRVSGPSLAGHPSTTNPFWTQWFARISQQNTIPDIYSWHSLSNEADPQRDLVTFNNFRAQYNTPVRPIDINEYGTPSEQSAATSVWYMARFERTNIRGLRANWASASDLHDYMANVLGKNGQTYFPNGDYQAYKYYAAMSGTRVATSGSADNLFDVFATKGTGIGSVKILAGNRRNLNTYDITITGLTSVGLPASGTVKIRTRRFNWTGQYQPVTTVSDLGIVEHSYTNNAVTFWVTPDTIETAYAFEFVQ
ncbi:glycoside hydrolase superfamily [Pyrenochaeta sp. MPI-SDFR-AT-0127]|nr:glycoside hydrolase superfamily [Pyrenochaeta sp. MPI-SDFR-AT-0127]